MQIKTTVSATSHCSEWPSLKSQQITNTGEGAMEGILPTLLMGTQVGAATMENSMEISQKTKNRVAIWSSNPTLGHVSGQNYDSKRIKKNPTYVNSGTIHISQDVETT